jgi:hypothetical protein
MAQPHRGWQDSDSGVSGRRMAADQAHLLNGPLDRNRVGFAEQVAVQADQLRVEIPRSRPSPLAAATHISCIRRGATLAVTEMVPWPPSMMKAIAVMSSPV